MNQTVNTRDDVTIGLFPPSPSAPVEWCVSDGLVAYDHALAVMAARASMAASASG